MIIASASEILMLPYKNFTMLNSTSIKFEDIFTKDKELKQSGFEILKNICKGYICLSYNSWYIFAN